MKVGGCESLRGPVFGAHRLGLNPDRLRRMVFDLAYTPHGGSGLGFGYDEIMEMPVAEICEFIRMLDEQRSDEAKKIRSAR